MAEKPGMSLNMNFTIFEFSEGEEKDFPSDKQILESITSDGYVVVALSETVEVTKQEYRRLMKKYGYKDADMA